MIFFAVMSALLGLVAADTIICSDFGGGGGEYYVRPIPGNCRGKHGDMANWKPTYKIKNRASRCPGGWKKYKNACYSDGRETFRGHKSYHQGEDHCNQNKGHIFIPNDQKEYLWVEQNVMRHNEWYYLGFFCAKSRTSDLSQVYTNTGEDMRKINKKLRGRIHPGQWVAEHENPCLMCHRNNNDWRFKYHHQHGHDKRNFVCETPL